MTEIPEGLPTLYDVRKLDTLMMYFIKQIRRHHSVVASVLNKDGTTFHKIGFELVDPKKTEGQTTGDGQTFNTIYEAWQYYKDFIIRYYNDEHYKVS